MAKLDYIRINLREKGKIPTTLVEDLLSLHPAIDVDSGHIACHYTTFSLLVAETRRGAVPMIVIDDCILLTAGEANIVKLVEQTRPGLEEVIIKPRGVIKVGSIEISNPDVVELLLSNTNLNVKFYEVEIEEIGRGVVAIARSEKEKENPIALIIIPCRKPEREGRGEALHY